MNNKKFVLFGYSNYYKNMFKYSDYNKNNYIFFDEQYFVKHHRLIWRIREVVNKSRIIKRILDHYFPLFWYKFQYNPQEIDKKYPIFIFFQINPFAQNTKFLKYLKRKYPKGKFCYWLTNSIELVNIDLLFLKRNYDLVISVSKKDSGKYGFFYQKSPYRAEVEKDNIRSKYDVFLCCHDKERRKTVEKLFVVFSKNDIKCKFILICDENEIAGKVEGIDYLNLAIDYSEVVKYIKESNCLLDVVAGKEDQEYLPLRYSEAIVFSKKYLSNSKILTKDDLFNNSQMRFYLDPDNIDFEWIKEPNNTNHFVPADSVSPEVFLNNVLTKLNQIGETV